MASPLGRFRRLGLRWRLAGWVAALSLLCLAIAFVAVYSGTGTQVRRQIDDEIGGDAGELAHNLAQSNPGSSVQAAQDATRYVRGQPFRSSSTLLFAVIPGAGTVTNVPELFGDPAPDRGETAAEQAQENRLSARLLTVGEGYKTLPLPDVGDLRVFKRTVRLAGVSGGPVVVGVGEPLAAVARAQRGVARAFVLAGVLALAGALLGAWLIGTRMSRPLRRMAAVAARVDAGDLTPRIHNDGQANETRVLADAFNHMLDRLTEAFAAQRAFVADASHELRTPLTVIRGQLEVLAAQRHPPEQELHRVESLVQAEIARTTRLVDDLLLLAKAEQPQFLRSEPIELPAFVEELWSTTAMLARRRFELHGTPDGTLIADPDRLAQALRNLLANAIEHTAPDTGLVALRVQPAPPDRIRFIVADDGPGIPADQLTRVFDRFHRTDSARDRASGGTGLGLAIVSAIAKAHGGRVRASESPAGGAQVELELPHFTRQSEPPATRASLSSAAGS
ncbi:MAG TPA: HAMP domain-containing sensor histidine kinase [Solirubrobacteraceae bacterium]|nr:HAMP domain-containing sensor histidine kinase [Solirubrobacteraceae bacterium]